MSIRTILRYPNPGLFRVCARVTAFDNDLRKLTDDLADTMRAAPGVGITAAHIGVDARVFVLELSKEDGLRVYVNLEILESSKATIIHNEGSVSMPGAVEEVERPTSIRVRYQDLDGALHEETAEGFHAVCIQHETDQLNGIFWLQRLSRLKRERLVTKWKKAQR